MAANIFVLSSVILVTLQISCWVSALDNGLARTPPRGWQQWQRFRCNTDCDRDPANCISERLFREHADRLAADGWLEAGYEYVMIDDCWPAQQRDAQGNLIADPKRFPSGMKALIDYVHSKGLKFGIYEDFGTKTCAGFPGIQFTLQQDINTMVGWGIDLIKLDGCNSDPHVMEVGYQAVEKYLNQTGRPVLFSCSYPAYMWGSISFSPQTLQTTCNTWRIFDDIQDSWQSILGIINFWGTDKPGMQAWAGPGHWNDADMLIQGDFGLSYEQERVQLAIWTIVASPLYISADLRNIRASSKALLLNRNVLNISADPLGIAGRRVAINGAQQIWTRPVVPAGSFAIALLNTDDEGTPSRFTFTLSSIGLTNPNGYVFVEVFDNTPIGKFVPANQFTTLVNPTGVQFYRATVISSETRHADARLL